MDWYLSRDGLLAVGTRGIRHEIRDYLARHGEPGADVADAELVVQELLSNALEHAAGPVWVRLSWPEEYPDIEVWDLGPGFTLPAAGTAGTAAPAAAVGDGAALGDGAELPDLELPDLELPDLELELPDLDGEGGRGLFIVRRLAAAFEVRARASGGTKVTARLPVRRAVSRTFPPVPSRGEPLPALEEADDAGSFGPEAFLRALVVQLSQAVELTAGPAVGEEVVSQVGATVGSQMESAYRASRALAGTLTPEQIADCLVRLKHAISGRFRVVEITADRIVLDNTRCPFGLAVRKAPALCRMTSSVFGGIAARNTPDGAAVVLEERIAVGDPGCRVVIHLGPPPEQSARFAHRYRRPPGATPALDGLAGTPT